MLSSVVSTSRATVKIPSRKTAGSTIAANGINTSAEPERNPIATDRWITSFPATKAQSAETQ
jgi:hypothetical protein